MNAGRAFERVGCAVFMSMYGLGLLTYWVRCGHYVLTLDQFVLGLWALFLFAEGQDAAGALPRLWVWSRNGLASAFWVCVALFILGTY